MGDGGPGIKSYSANAFMEIKNPFQRTDEKMKSNLIVCRISFHQ